MDKYFSLLPKFGENLVALGAIGAMLTGTIVFFGGQIPPWIPAAKESFLEQKITAVSVDFNKFREEINQIQCLDYLDRLERAQMKLKEDPNDTTAKLLQKSAREHLHQIPGCDE